MTLISDKVRISAVMFLVVALLVQSSVVLAFETDQYNLPPVPLADVGDEVTEYVLASVSRAVDIVNSEIERTRTCLESSTPKPKGCGTRTETEKRLTELLADDAVRKELYDILGGDNILVTKFGKWMLSHKFRSEPSSYKADFTESIYITRPADYMTLSPTVKLYGVEFGVDKLEHMFQQGYRYQQIRTKALAEGATPVDAVIAAVRWGQKTERTYFGSLSSGVYSNADLVANYTGMKFYDGLTKPITIGATYRPATLIKVNGNWQLNDDPQVSETLLRPFFSEHLNEALNPSAYAVTLFPFVRQVVKKRGCPDWRSQFPGLSRTDLNEKSRSLEFWNGEDYGYTKKSRSLSLGDMCFGEPAGTRGVPVAIV